MSDAVLRTIAVVAAAGLVAAPYWRHFASVGAQAAAAARQHWVAGARLTAACLIVAAAWGVVPMPRLSPAAPAVAIEVDAPSAAMQATVEPVTKALAGASVADRNEWAAVWLKCAVVVDAERTSTTPAFADTPALRAFTTVALDIAWRRLGDHAPGSLPGLREAVEAAMRTALGLDAVPVSADVRARYSDVCRAIAWAGLQR